MSFGCVTQSDSRLIKKLRVYNQEISSPNQEDSLKIAYRKPQTRLISVQISGFRWLLLWVVDSTRWVCFSSVLQGWYNRNGSVPWVGESCCQWWSRWCSFGIVCWSGWQLDDVSAWFFAFSQPIFLLTAFYRWWYMILWLVVSSNSAVVMLMKQ